MVTGCIWTGFGPVPIDAPCTWGPRRGWRYHRAVIDYSNDPISSILRIMVETVPAIPLETIKAVDRQVRAHWGETRPCIRKARADSAPHRPKARAMVLGSRAGFLYHPGDHGAPNHTPDGCGRNPIHHALGGKACVGNPTISA